MSEMTLDGINLQAGKITAGQLVAVLHARDAIEQFAAAPTLIKPELILSLGHAMAELTDESIDRWMTLPLDQFLDGVQRVTTSALATNAEYLAGPVTQAIGRLAGMLQAAAQGSSPQS
jgi:hypothetical protein